VPPRRSPAERARLARRLKRDTIFRWQRLSIES